MTKLTTIDLLRHGEPVGGRKYRGAVDDPLSAKGWEELRAATRGRDGWNGIVSSPLLRCLEFAHELGTQRGLAVEVEPRFCEIGMGAWEGRYHDEIEAANPGVLQRHALDPINHLPAGGEPVPAFCQRIAAGWQQLEQRYAGQHVLVICHAGVIRAALALHLDMPMAAMYRIHVPSASLARVTVQDTPQGRLPQLIFHGLPAPCA